MSVLLPKCSWPTQHHIGYFGLWQSSKGILHINTATVLMFCDCQLQAGYYRPFHSYTKIWPLFLMRENSSGGGTSKSIFQLPAISLFSWIHV